MWRATRDAMRPRHASRAVISLRFTAAADRRSLSPRADACAAAARSVYLPVRTASFRRVPGPTDEPVRVGWRQALPSVRPAGPERSSPPRAAAAIRNRFAVERSTEGPKSSLRRRDRPRRSRAWRPFAAADDDDDGCP